MDELDRAVGELGLKGVMLFSNVNGRPLDSKELIPIYEKTAKLDVPLFIHPTSPLNDQAMDDYRLVPIMGFTVDTALALFRLVFSGILERLPQPEYRRRAHGGRFPVTSGEG